MTLQAIMVRRAGRPRTPLYFTVLLTVIVLSFSGLGVSQADNGSVGTSRQVSDWYGSNSQKTTNRKRKKQSANSTQPTSRGVAPQRSAPLQAVDPWSEKGTTNRQPETRSRLSAAADKDDIKRTSEGGRAQTSKNVQRIKTSVPHRANTVRPALEETIVDQPSPISETPDLDNGGDSCGRDDCGACMSCMPTCRSSCRGIEFRAEALLWWTNGFDTPPLATTSPDGTTDPNTAGVLGQPGTRILFGGEDLNDNLRGGGRYSISKRLGHCVAVEASYLHLGRKKEDFSAGGNDSPIVDRPFFNVELGEEGSGITAFPNVSSGTLDITATSEFDLFDLSVRRTMCQGYGFHVDLLAGYRYSQLDEDLTFRDFNESLSGLAAGTTFDIRDSFATNNEFHGGQLGLLAELQQSCWTFEFLMKIALGNSHAMVDINGSTEITPPGTPPENLQGGFLALPSNTGQEIQDKLAIMPEFGLTISRPLGCCWQASAGYSFLYWSRVVRPGNQIDRNLDPRQFPPPAPESLPQPESQYQFTDFWAQGLRFGLERTW